MKRGRLEIMRDILELIQKHHNSIKPTPLLRKSNLSSARFKEYYSELMDKRFIVEVNGANGRSIKLTEKGFRFLEKYKTILGFIEEFEL